MRITAAGAIIHKGAAVFNEDGGDNDFRVESNNQTNALHVYASQDMVAFGPVNTAPWVQTSGNGAMSYRVTQQSMALATDAATGYANLYLTKYNLGVAGGDNRVIAFYGNSGTTTNTVGTITVSTSSTTYSTSSDYRLKTDAQPMTGASARVQALNPVNFEWIADGSRVDGFLAHEAATVVPESVTGTKDAMMDEEYEVTAAVLDDDGNETTAAVMGTRSVPDYQGIDQSKLVPLLTAALQEALTKIEAMEARLTALESV